MRAGDISPARILLSTSETYCARHAAESGTKRGAPNSATPNWLICSWAGTEISQSMNWLARSLRILSFLAGLTAMTP